MVDGRDGRREGAGRTDISEADLTGGGLGGPGSWRCGPWVLLWPLTTSTPQPGPADSI